MILLTAVLVTTGSTVIKYVGIVINNRALFMQSRIGMCYAFHLNISHIP